MATELQVSDDTIELPDRRQILTLKQAADLCGVDYDTILKIVQAGTLTAFELPGVRAMRVYRRDVEKLFQPSRYSR